MQPMSKLTHSGGDKPTKICPPRPTTTDPKQRFRVPISTTKRGQMVQHGSPWLDTHYHCHQMVAQQRPKG